ncbi:MAG: hypothetical protein PHV23_05995 [Candidatus Gracilibacteria bacterium]|nr:hypothetical protein [Candidatus Gracilibacteria bacterium]
MKNNMKIHCNSGETMILSSESNKIFEEIVKDLNIENKEYICSLYRRVKAIEKVSDDELNFLYNFLISKEFKEKYEEKISTFIGRKDKLEHLKYSNIMSSFLTFMNKSKVIFILDLGTDDITLGGKKYIRLNIGKAIKKAYKGPEKRINLDGDNEIFEKFSNKRKTDKIDKYKYLEFIDENNDYIIGIDLRSGLYLLIEKATNNIVHKSKELLFFKKIGNNNYCFVGYGESGLILVLGNNYISISKETKIHGVGNELYLIDEKLNTVFKIGGKISSLGEGKIIKIIGTKIDFLNTINHQILEYDIRTGNFEIKN